jgi:hypothetical protein
MQQSHWLDDVFDDPDKAKDAFLAHPKAIAAFSAATRAYQDQVHFLKLNPGLKGPSPAQGARDKFLEELGLQIPTP